MHNPPKDPIIIGDLVVCVDKEGKRYASLMFSESSLTANRNDDSSRNQGLPLSREVGLSHSHGRGISYQIPRDCLREWDKGRSWPTMLSYETSVEWIDASSRLCLEPKESGPHFSLK